MSDKMVHDLHALPQCKDIAAWSERTSLPMFAAKKWFRFAPRGKGAVPRWIGRTFGRNWTRTVQTKSGCRLAVDPPNLDIFVTIQNQGYWEAHVREACIASLRQGDTMFDVGANVGAISNEIALACPTVKIMAFEPQAELAQLISVSAALNGNENINVYPVAIGERAGTVQLHKPSHALHASTMTSGDRSEVAVECTIVTLDECVAAGELPVPNLIKIDVEGGELNVLRGSRNLLAKHQPIVLFEANSCCEKFGYTRDDLFQLFSDCAQYRFFAVCQHDLLAVPASRAEKFVHLYSELSPRAAA